MLKLHEFKLVVHFIFDLFNFDFGKLNLVIKIEQTVKGYSLFNELHDRSGWQNTSVLVYVKLFLVFNFLILFDFVVEIFYC